MWAGGGRQAGNRDFSMAGTPTGDAHSRQLEKSDHNRR